MIHYNQLKETLKTKFNICLPKEAYHHLSEDVEIIEIPLKDLRVPCGHRKICTIPETSVYKWLISDREQPYFWNYNEANVHIPKSKENSQKQMKNLVISIAKKYDPSVCVIAVRKNNTIIDGQHRAAVLYHKYGGDYKILVVREK